MTKPSKHVSLAASLALFLTVFILWQIHNYILVNFPLSTLDIYIFNLIIPSISLVLFAGFTKILGSNFRRQGFRHPTTIRTKVCVGLVSLCLGIYFVVILSSGFFRGGIVFLGVRTDPFLFFYRIVSAVIYGFAGETVFRGFIFRNLARNYNFFASLYGSSLLFSIHQIAVRKLLLISMDEFIIFLFTDVLTLMVAGLFLGFLFYKTGWSLLAPLLFVIGTRYYFDPLPIASPGGLSWWMAITFEMAAYACLILLIDYAIKEPGYRRRKYGLEG